MPDTSAPSKRKLVWVITEGGHVAGVATTEKLARDWAFALAKNTNRSVVTHGPFDLIDPRWKP